MESGSTGTLNLVRILDHIMRWTLAIATYNRPDALRECIKYALAQSCPPYEIAVVDASSEWASSRQMVLKMAGLTHVAYEPAHIRGSAVQRNQLIKIATGDVLSLIDDDSYMHRACAAEIMKVYEADTDNKVVGVGALQTFAMPDDSTSAMELDQPNRPSLRDKLNALFEQELDVERMLLPYDENYPDHPVPPSVSHLNVGSTRYMNGFRMTFRRSIISQIGFDESLKKYASAEDMDASYRASRFGALLNAYDARIFHDKSPNERLSRHTRELLGYMNLAYLYRIKGHDPKRLMMTFSGRLLRRMAVDAMRDASKQRLSFPCVRADLKALSLLPKILNDRDIDGWYQAMQEKIISRNIE